MKDTNKIADLESRIAGTRPLVTVTSENRGLVRQWLTANGASYASIASLPISQLSLLYNHPDALEIFLSEAPEQQTETEAKPEPKAPQSPAQSQPSKQPMNAQQKALQALLDTLTPEAPALDEARIMQLIQEHAPKSPIVTVQLVGMQPKELRELPAKPRHSIFPTLLVTIQAENVFLVGPAGSGKTTLAEQAAEALSVPFYFTGAVSSEYKLTGFIDAQGRTVRTAFREAFENGGLFLFDEIDASSPSALLAFNAALSNGQFDFPDGTVKRHKDFYCIASGNTWGSGASREYIGRNQLDAASLDRFAKLSMDYDNKLEIMIAQSLFAEGEAVAAYVIQARDCARLNAIRHVISPRASFRLSRLLALGMDLDDALDASIFCGMDIDAQTKIKSGEEVKAALSALTKANRRAQSAAQQAAA